MNRTALGHRLRTEIPRGRLGKLIAEPAEPWTAREESRLRERRGRERQRAAEAGPGHELVFTDRVVATLITPHFQLPHAALAVPAGDVDQADDERLAGRQIAGARLTLTDVPSTSGRVAGAHGADQRTSRTPRRSARVDRYLIDTPSQLRYLLGSDIVSDSRVSVATFADPATTDTREECMPPIERTLAYTDGETPLTGALYRDESQQKELPGVLLIHGGAGLDDHARHQAQRWAALGYVVLACDMYGDGVAGDRQRIMTCVTALRDDPALLVSRARAGLDALRNQAETDGRLAAVGFCFGGMAALALARSGEGIAGAVSIHGSLKTSAPAEPHAVRAKILVCHGASDPHVPPADVAAFTQEMEDACADWQLIMYSGAQHGFTHRHAQPGATPGVAYDERADRLSFAAASRFLADAFAM